MNNIKVYNIKKFIEQEMPHRRICGYNRGLAIVEGKSGIVVFDDEACGWSKNTTNATIEIGLTDIPAGNSFYCAPQYMIDVPLKDLLTAEYTEMLITEFVERYNTKQRIKSNFQEIVNAISRIGA